jgi:hypothetical protein
VARPKFIADADFNEHVIAGILRIESGIDFLSASDGGTRGLNHFIDLLECKRPE